MIKGRNFENAEIFSVSSFRSFQTTLDRDAEKFPNFWKISEFRTIIIVQRRPQNVILNLQNLMSSKSAWLSKKEN